MCLRLQENRLRPQFQNLCHQNSATLQLALQSWFMKAAGPSHNCAQFLRQLYITEKSFFPGCKSMASSSSLSSAMQPTRHDIFSFLYLYSKKKEAIQTILSRNMEAEFQSFPELCIRWRTVTAYRFRP